MFKKILALLAVVVFSGCALAPARKGRTDGWDITRTLFHQTGFLKAEQAFLTGKTLLLKGDVFSQDSDGKHVFWAKAVLDFCYAKSQPGSRNFHALLEPVTKQDWDQSQAFSSEAREPVRILDHYQWAQIKEAFAEELLKDQSGKGVSVALDGQDFVLYYDAEDRWVFIPKAMKPAELDVAEAFSQQEMENAFFASLRSFLDGESEFSGKALLALPKHEETENPFLYVDLKEEVIAGLHFAQKGRSSQSVPLFKRGIKTADYLIWDSHVWGIAARPFSSVLRLFFWSQNTAYDVINPQKMPAIQTKPVAALNPQRDRMDLDAFEQLLDKVAGRNLSSGKMKFLINGDAFFPRLIQALEHARESIYVRIFIFDNDDYALKIADLLKAKSKEKGVKVYVLLDRMGQLMGEGNAAEDLPEGFVPPDSMAAYLKKDSNIHVRVTPSALLKADHVKTIIIDEEVCFTGGMNIGREYRYDWHDVMAEVSGPVVSAILKDFDLAWANAGPLGDFEYLFKRLGYKRKKMPQTGDYPIRPLFTRLNHPQIYQAQVLAIRQAKDYVYIHNAYFSDNTVLRALIQARKRGVDVRVILPLASNHEIMNANNILIANKMFKNQIKVYFYPGMSHVKAAIYDGWLCFGSANFDRLSFRDNKELNLATSDAGAVTGFQKRLFEKDFQKSRLMDKPLDSGWKDYIAAFLADQL